MSTHKPGSPVTPDHQGHEVRYVLRDLTGIAEIEELFTAAARHPNPLWAPELDQVNARIEPTSRSLFGIADEETEYMDDPTLDDRENEARYELWEDFLEEMEDLGRDDVVAGWRKLGWDVWDADGQPLLCFKHFVRQILSATMGLAGHLPGSRAELNEQQELDLEARLRAEAEQHRRAGTSARPAASRPNSWQRRPAARFGANGNQEAARGGDVVRRQSVPVRAR